MHKAALADNRINVSDQCDLNNASLLATDESLKGRQTFLHYRLDNANSEQAKGYYEIY